MNPPARSMRRPWPFLLMAVTLVLLPMPAWPTEAPITDDASTSSLTSHHDLGRTSSLVVKAPSRYGGTQSSYLRFNLDTLPAGTTGDNVAKATLLLSVDEVHSQGSFQVQRVLGTWNKPRKLRGSLLGRSVREIQLGPA